MRRRITRALCAAAAGVAVVSCGSGSHTTGGAVSSPASAAWPAHPVTAYIVNSGSDTVTPIRTATNTAGKAINAGTAPVAIAITPDGTTAYVASEGLFGRAGTVTPIRTATNTAGKAINAGSVPSAIAITPDGTTAYVTDIGPFRAPSDTVTPIRIATGTAGKTIKVGTAPLAIAITPSQRRRGNE